MKKLMVAVLAAVMMVGSFSPVAEASAISDLRDTLVSYGVPSDLANNVSNYLSKVNLSESEAAAFKAKVEQAYALVKDQTDLTNLSKDVKNQLVSLANEAAKMVGLVIKYEDFGGSNKITITTANGEVLGSLSSSDIKELLTSFDASIFKELADKVTPVIPTPGTKPEVNPMPDTDLGDTGLGLSAMSLAGLGLMGAAGSMAVVSKRKQK